MAIKNIFNQFIVFLNRKHEDKQFGKLRLLVFYILITGLLMWSYTISSFLYFDDSVNLKYLGIVYSIVHISSLFFYRVYGSIYLSTYIFLISGLFFQFHHAAVTGGIFSTTVIWFSILPLLGGVLCGLRHMVIWFFISSLCTFIQILLTVYAPVEVHLSNSAIIWFNANVTYGYTLLNFSLIYIFIKDRDKRIITLAKKNDDVRNLVRILSHDIINPLTVIKLTVNRLGKNSDPNDKSYKILANSTQNIIEIINTVKQLDIVCEGKNLTGLSRIHINKYLHESVDNFKVLVENKGITITLDEGDESLYIMGNGLALKNQVFSNLLSNAVKFSEKGSRINISIDASDNEVHIIFIDDGVGIPNDKIQYLFDPTIKTTTKGTLGEKGSGFGMPIVKTIIDSTGGSIFIESFTKSENPIGHGTKIIISFPKI